MSTKRTPPPINIVTRSRHYSIETPPVVNLLNDIEVGSNKRKRMDGVSAIVQEPVDCKILENKIDELLVIVKNSNELCVSLSKNVCLLMDDNTKLRHEISLLSGKNVELITEVHKIKEKDEVWSANCEALKKSNDTVITCVENVKHSLTHAMSAKSTVINPNDTFPSFASMVKSAYPVLVVKPKDITQKCETTIAEIRKAIDPNGIQIRNVRNTRNGGIAIECGNKDAHDKLKMDATTLLGADFNVTVPQKRIPKVRVMGLSELSDNLVETIKSQNDHIFGSSSTINVVHTFPLRNRVSYGFKMEIDSVSFGKLMQETKLRIGWDICRVYEEFDVIRCFNCSQLGHKSKDCTSDAVCPKCSGPHKIETCNSLIVKCPNCNKASADLRIHLDSAHEAWDFNCPVYLRKVAMVRKRIDYGIHRTDAAE